MCVYCISIVFNDWAEQRWLDYVGKCALYIKIIYLHTDILNAV